MRKLIDGGWGWMCVMGSFIMHMFLAGHQKSFSLLYIVLRRQFESSAAFTAWVGGTNVAIRMICSMYGNTANEYTNNLYVYYKVYL